MSGLALPGPGAGRAPHASINPSALSRPPHSANQPTASGSGSGSGSNTNNEGKDVATTQGAQGGKEEIKDKMVASVPEITVVEGLVPTLQ